MILNKNFFVAKKKFGQWGEEKVDAYFSSLKWETWQKNYKFRGGEIDRVYYQFEPYNFLYTFCLCEIKSVTIYSVNNVQNLFSEVNLKSLLKTRQIKNLEKYGYHLLALFPNSRIFLRIFILIKFTKPNLIKIFDLNDLLPAKICTQNSEYLQLSFCPDIVYGHNNSSLQISAN